MIIMPDHTALEIRNLLDGFLLDPNSFNENENTDSQFYEDTNVLGPIKYNENFESQFHQETNLMTAKITPTKPNASNKAQFIKAKKTFQCSSCGKFFDNYKQLKVHKYQVHPSDYGSIKCKICYKILKTKSILINHMLTHNSSAFSCSICLKNFNRKHHLERHEKNCKGLLVKPI